MGGLRLVSVEPFFEFFPYQQQNKSEYDNRNGENKNDKKSIEVKMETTHALPMLLRVFQVFHQ